jgi:hypothetical protein
MQITLHDIKRVGEFRCNVSHLNKMAAKIKAAPQNVYEIVREYGGLVDSVTRETIFSYIADKYHGGDYDKIYYAWLGIPKPNKDKGINLVSFD